jgi:hypothetical protein
MFADQPAENSGGFTLDDLIDLGRRVGLTSSDYLTGLREGRYEAWSLEIDRLFQEQDPNGTPAALLDGQPVDQRVLFDPKALVLLLNG